MTNARITKGFRFSGRALAPGHWLFALRTFSRHAVFVIRHSSARFLMLVAVLLGSRAVLAIPAVPTANEWTVASPKIVRYAERLLTRYDTDQNDHLSRDEWSKMRGRPDILDRDRDGKATLDELIRHVADYGRYRRLSGNGVQGPLPAELPTDAPTSSNGAAGDSPTAPFYVPPKLRPAGLPTWFAERDGNGDGQLSLAEYAPTGARDAVATFTRLDGNRDGLLTPTECQRPAEE